MIWGLASILAGSAVAFAAGGASASMWNHQRSWKALVTGAVMALFGLMLVLQGIDLITG
jgi:hypothetical protein